MLCQSIASQIPVTTTPNPFGRRFDVFVGDVAQLTPRLWKEHFAANPLTSDIGKGVLELAPKSAA